MDAKIQKKNKDIAMRKSKNQPFSNFFEKWMIFGVYQLSVDS